MSVGEFYRRYLSSESTFWEDACKVSECTGKTANIKYYFKIVEINRI